MSYWKTDRDKEVITMTYRTVSDSSSNIITMENPNYVSVPMKVRADKEYVDMSLRPA